MYIIHTRYVKTPRRSTATRALLVNQTPVTVVFFSYAGPNLSLLFSNPKRLKYTHQIVNSRSNTSKAKHSRANHFIAYRYNFRVTNATRFQTTRLADDILTLREHTRRQRQRMPKKLKA